MHGYSDADGVAVTICVRKHGMDGPRRNRYRKTGILKSVTFTLDTDPPTPAPPLGGG